MHGLAIRGAYLHVEEWHIRWTEYRLNNSSGDPAAVLVEHPRRVTFDLFDAPAPVEKTDEHFRFEVRVTGRGEAVLRIQERALQSRREELQRQSYRNLQDYLREGLMDRSQHDHVIALLQLWARVSENEEEFGRLNEARERVYEAQQQIQGNMGALGTKGKEGSLRARYVKELEATEEQLKELTRREATLKDDIERIKKEIDTIIKTDDKIKPQPPEPKPIVQQWVKILDKWASGTDIPQNKANELRNWIRDGVKSNIDWDKELLFPMELNQKMIYILFLISC